MTAALDRMLARAGKTKADLCGRKAGQTTTGRIFRRKGVAKTEGFERVRKIPRRRWQDDPDLEAMRLELTEWLALPLRPECQRKCGHETQQKDCEQCIEAAAACACRGEGFMEFRPVQAAALQEMHDYGGLFAPVRVGAGKTLISYTAGVVMGAARPLLLVPAKLARKTGREFAELRRHWLGHPRLEVMAYELLSRDRGGHELERINPDLIICDEGHKAKNREAGVTRKLRRWFRERPETRLCAMSGTITTRSILEYEHLLRWCLPNHAPLPTNWGELQDWADAIDEKVDPLRRLNPGALLEFCSDEEILEAAFGGENATAAARKAYRRRLTETPGVVATEEGHLGCSIQITALNVDLSPASAAAFRMLRRDWQTPDGWEIMEAMEIWRHARELACGFYYTWWNQEGFNRCLDEMLKKDAGTIGSIERKILRDCVRTTERDTALVLAIGRLGSANRINSSGTSKLAMGSHPNNTNGFLPSMMAPATCAKRKGEQAESEAVVAATVSRLITITKQAKSGDYFAPPATERLEIWEMILKASKGLWTILSTAVNAARPPEEWLEPRKQWARFVREILRGNRRGIDTEDQVAKACRAGALDSDILDAWQAVRPTFEPNTVPVWIDDAMLRAAAGWLEEERGLCWVEHRAFGQRLADLANVPYFARNGCDASGLAIEDMPAGPCVLSIASNSEGRNLQDRWSKNLIVSCPPNGRIWEQLAGRTHREGQQADEVTFDVAMACIEQWKALQQALKDAQYIEHTTGQAQKLRYADLDLPSPDEVAARGQQNPMWEE